MPSEEEKQRRKQIMRQIRVADEALLLKYLPLNPTLIKKLFDYLDTQLGEVGCDDTLELTKQFAEANQVSFEPLKTWLNEHGGYCDCEVLANVEEKFESYL